MVLSLRLNKALSSFSCREIALTRQFRRNFGPLVPAYADFKHYYMGLYVQSNAKMCYKGQFAPSYLLCPVTFNFVPIEACRGAIASGRFVAFGKTSTSEVEEENDLADETMPCVLANSPEIADLLPRDSYALEEQLMTDGSRVAVCVTTIGASKALLDAESIQRAQEWTKLVGRHRGTLRISFL